MANPQRENGHLDIANEIVEFLMRTEFSGGEFRLILAVLRKTWAWQKKEDWISLSQLAKMTGFSRRYVCRVKKQLVNKKTLLEVNNALKFNKNYDEWVVNKKTPPVNKKTLGSEQKGDRVVNKKTHTKDTTTKDTTTKENNAKALVASPQYGNPQINECLDFLKSQLKGELDGASKYNRNFCHNLLNRFKKEFPNKDPVFLVKWLINFGLTDDFHGPNITSFRYLYYNSRNIINKAKKKFDEQNQKISDEELFKSVKTTK